jgi:rhamnulokinase
MTEFLAFDLGAQSGRAMLGKLSSDRLKIREIARFPNGMVRVQGHVHWDIPRLFNEILRALRICGKSKLKIESTGIDTWGVDFALLAKDGGFLGLPYAYRDKRTAGAMDGFFERMKPARLYELTGIQIISINTIFQLYAARRDCPEILDAAQNLLFIPDIFNYLLTGVKSTEFTFATTSQLYNPVKRRWENEIFDALRVNPKIMQKIIKPGTKIGTLKQEFARETGLGAVTVVAPGTHDTASAVAAVPAEGTGWAYISSGTWSLIGVEIPKPIISEAARKFNFTNEGGVFGTFRFLKNIAGLWLLEECRRKWSRASNVDYGKLLTDAETAPPLKSLLRPDNPAFLNPRDMESAICAYFRKTGQPAPRTRGALARAILESLALRYKEVLGEIEKVTGDKIRRIHVVGGGSKNALICRFAADATGLPVYAGPAEATAIGNVLMQAASAGMLKSHKELRAVVRNSFKTILYEPRGSADWDAAFERFRNLP